LAFFNSIWLKIFLCLLIIAIVLNESFINVNKDFTIFIEASKLVFEGKNCYNIWLHSGTAGLKYYYSPLFAVILFPLKDLPQGVANFGWLSFNLFLILRIFRLVVSLLEIRKEPTLNIQYFILFLLLVSFRFIFDCFSLGQMTFILVWATLESLRLINQNKKIRGSFLLALVINIKLLPIAVLAYYFYKGELKAAFLTTIFWVAFLIVPSFFIGFNFNNLLLAEWFESIFNASTNSLTEDYGRQSLSSFVPALFMETPIQFGIKRNLLNLSSSQVTILLSLLRMLIIIMTLLIIGNPFNNAIDSKKTYYEISLICALTPLFFPHQGNYSFLYLLPAYAYCIFVIMKETSNKMETVGRINYCISFGFIILSFTLGTLTTSGILGRKLANISEYLCCITISTLSLLISMILLRPKKSNNFFNSESLHP